MRVYFVSWIIYLFDQFFFLLLVDADCDFAYTAAIGEFNSLNYEVNGVYDNGMNCRWVITTAANKQINLEFYSDFYLESTSYDYVTIAGAKGVCL